MNSLLLHLIHQQLARGSRQVAGVGGLQKSPLLLAATPLEQGELKEEKESKGKEEEEEKKTLAPPPPMVVSWIGHCSHHSLLRISVPLKSLTIEAPLFFSPKSSTWKT